MDPNKLKDELGKLLFNLTPDEAIRQNICICCKETPQFKTKAGQQEYELSGLCEACFDEEFMDLEE